ncbi:EAL domain-containing protein [Glaciimonas sp. PCH181]|uniref:EAL domain-containing protein n=1 Tax=Glaciimonas sp. PCH181 TaxID=2133943 RepID=UPI000D3735CD|nr:EAL domain-containing protein [Glaciimonas sp. PCH181]PUA17814.1 hypothetical protein C7W93_18310 [Glaciimonas sp. PCH181]
MHRIWVIILATLAALIGAVGPIALTLHLSLTRATSVEEQRLQYFAQRALERTNMTFRGANAALNKFDYMNVALCSEEHIRQMRMVTVTSRNVDDIGYVENGALKCTAGGLTHKKIKQAPVDFTTQDGISVSLGTTPEVSGGKSMAALYHNSYVALIDSERFTDIILDPTIQLVVQTSNGKLLGALNDPNLARINTMINTPTKRENRAYGGDHLFAVVRDAGLVAVAVEPHSNILGQLQRERMVLLPFGFLMAAFIVGIVIWVLRRRLSPLGELKIAVERREFVVYYQPIVKLSTGLCIGAEALVRWQHPDGSMTRPDLFIPLAEESGLILPITDQVIAAVVRDMKKCLASNSGLHIAINLSAQDIKTGRVLAVLESALRDTGIKPKQIWLEATERGFMDIEAARTTICRARTMGFAVAIDDFGTGYSSLSYLLGFPLDALKIDKSFIDTIGTDSATSSVTPHIIGMAKTLQLDIIAEGIETQEQADYLLAREVEYGQGWLFAKALPAEEFLNFYRRNQASKVEAV